MNELRALFRQALASRIAELDEALALLRDDYASGADEADAAARIRRIAHSLRGSGGTYGFPQVSALAAAAEDAAPDGLQERAAHLLALLRDIVAAGNDGDPAAAGPAAIDSPRRALRVLIVDDDAEIRLLTGFLLREAGHVVGHAGDMASALSAVHAFAPDVVLMDVMLGSEDGLDAAVRIRAAHAEPPDIVFVTGAVRPDQQRRLRAFTPAGIITKPFNVETFAAQLAAMLDHDA
ncbi:MAG TPA: response regulator [Longimicrobiales bacterium]|nr:response regulator [Longimicrobiales bacterium]